MFIITLNLTGDKTKAPEFMAAHNDWIAQGFADGVFVVVGSLKPQPGGAIIAIGGDIDAITKRVAQDPFVIEGIATPHIQEVAPARMDDRLAFLKDGA